MAEETYTPEEDVIERGADGVDRLIAAKGVPIPLAQAQSRGLIKLSQTVTPMEKKGKKDAKADEVAKTDDASATPGAGLTQHI